MMTPVEQLLTIAQWWELPFQAVALVVAFTLGLQSVRAIA